MGTLKIEKGVYPPLKEKSEIMLLAKKSLLKNMNTYMLQPNEWQFLLQCAWTIGFMEAKENSSLFTSWKKKK